MKVQRSLVAVVAVAGLLGGLVGGSVTYAAVRASFSDVPPGHPFYEQIQWAVDTGVVAGYPDGTFKPAREVTRQAAVAFLANYNEGIRLVSGPQDFFTAQPTRTQTVTCASDERALAGGGYEVSDGMTMAASYPSTAAGATAVAGGSSWTVRWRADGIASGWVQAWALCAPMRLPVG